MLRFPKQARPGRPHVSNTDRPPTILLADDHLAALRNLARKQAGKPVGWIVISAARGLADLGLAARNRSGWEITASGQTALCLVDSGVMAGAEVAMLQFTSRGGRAA